MLKVRKIRSQLIAEQTGVRLTLSSKDIVRLASIIPREDEVVHYDALEADLQRVVEKVSEPFSRQVYVAYGPVEGTKLHCISLVQLLLNREQDSALCAYMRSSLATRLPSDLGFLSRLALKRGCSKVEVLIGSFHVGLDPAELAVDDLGT